MERTHPRAVLVELEPWERCTLEPFMKDSIPWVGIHTRAAELYVRRKEWERQRFMNWPKPLFPMHLHCSGEGGRRIRSEIEPGKEGVASENVYNFVLFLTISFC